MKRKITIVDLFCGGGGESTGIHQAAMLAGYDIQLTRGMEKYFSGIGDASQCRL